MMIRAHAHAERLLNLSRQTIDSVRNINRPLFMVIDEMAFHSCMTPLTGYGLRSSHLFCL
jgi:hypothetical protein